ncbi:MAG: hypothetical protein LBG60_14975 [Bifidobacteriaceae bacterium]|nr:hypothetical protein [Bifidobacteriaceae bacterium]
MFFEFANPTAAGQLDYIDTKITCALCHVEDRRGTVVSTKPFTVETYEAMATIKLSPTGGGQAWHVTVEGAEGVQERWVNVPDSTAAINFWDLKDVDRYSLEVGPDTVPKWELVNAKADEALAQAGRAVTLAQGATAWRSDMSFPGPLEPKVGLMGIAWPWPVKIGRLTATVGGVPLGAPIILDVNVGGSTVFTDQTARPKIASGNMTGSATWEPVEVPAFARITVDIDQVGSDPDSPGNDLVVSVFAEPT